MFDLEAESSHVFIDSRQHQSWPATFGGLMIKNFLVCGGQVIGYFQTWATAEWSSASKRIGYGDGIAQATSPSNFPKQLSQGIRELAEVLNTNI